ncbi:MAG: excinuclease ABC subunit C [Candidatus Paceibacteria bacterium]|jgi:excinuclease ABC subunit C
MELSYLKNKKLPDSPGVYFFKKDKEILYIGKATSLKDRTKSYFANDLINTRSSRIVDMVTISNDIEVQETDSVLEALILEAELIKKHQPKYNSIEKDNKSFNYVLITKDDLPKVVVKRERNMEFEDKKYLAIFGPFSSKTQLEEALKIVRKIFPFYGEKKSSKLYEQIGFEPGEITKKEYLNNIRHIKLFFQGKKKKIIQSLEKEMMTLAKEKEFEKASSLKRKIFALNHIRDVSLIKDENIKASIDFRIESYDVAHLQGTSSVGVMTVVEDSEVKKSDYRKFILRKAKKGDDVGALEEILRRRLKHPEWPYPNLIVVDGGVGQRNRALKVLKENEFNIPVVSVVKNDKHKPEKFLGVIGKHERDVLIANSEAHRFAISFYRKTHRKKLK